MSDLTDRIHDVTERELLSRLGDSAKLGRGFCFFREGALASSLPGWMRSMVSDDQVTAARVVPLFGREPIELPGVLLEPTDWDQIQLQSVTSDRALYREDEDDVELLLYDPFQPSSEGFIEIERNGTEFGRRPYRIDKFGMATTSLSGLPAGEYSVKFDDSPDDEPPCEFIVAAYRMAGLTASLVQRELRDERLHATIEVRSYGSPVDGGVRVGLLSGGVRVDGADCQASDGTVDVDLRAEGDGPFDLEVQLAVDASRTATVRIVGTRKSEREESPVAAMNRDLAASLMPQPGAREIRGMYVTEQGSRIALFGLADIETTEITLTASTDLQAASAVLFEPGSEPRTVQTSALASGEKWQIDFGNWSSVAILAVGAITEDGRAWEGWTLVSAPRKFTPELVLPENPQPGETAEVGVRVDTPEAGEVYFVVKDARLVTPDTPSNRLAGSIKQWAADASETLGAGFVDRPLSDVLNYVRDTDEIFLEHVNYSAAPQGFGTQGAAPPAAMPRSVGAPAAAAAESVSRGRARREGAAPPGESDDAPDSQGESQVYFAGTARLFDGEAKVEVPLPDGFADIHVDAFVASQKDWGGVAGDFHVEKRPFLAAELPRFVHASDVATARLVAFCESGRMQVSATLDDEPVNLLWGEDPVAGPIAARRAELMFLARPGRVRATVEDLETGETWEVDETIEEPGKLRAVAKSLRLLEPGQIATTEEDDVIGLRILPGLEEPFDVLCHATADYGHACCEQTAAKMLAACAMYVFAGDDEKKRGEAKRIIEAGVRREESMYLPGQGFKMYPESAPRSNDYWGKKAARYLHYLKLIETDELAFGDVLKRGLEMGQDAAAAYGIQIPPSRPTTVEEAYLSVRFGASHSGALEIARKQQNNPPQSSRGPRGFGGAVLRRMDDAWAAATLLRAGSSGDLPAALAMANKVVSQIGPEGRLYSTADSVAAIALMAELQDAGIVDASGRVEVDGEECSTNDAASASEPQRIRCVEGRAPVEVSRVVEEDWEALRPDADIRVSLARNGRRGNHFASGDDLELIVEIADGYQNGDVLWVCLPDALSRLEGGGQVKLFSVDFAEKNELTIPLAATSVTLDESGEVTDQKYMVCLRNMFVEERAGNPGLLGVRVDSSGSGGMLEKLIGGLRRFWEK